MMTTMLMMFMRTRVITVMRTAGNVTAVIKLLMRENVAGDSRDSGLRAFRM